VIVRPVLCRPFIGRREELAYLRDRRLEAGASKGGFVLIAGDAGVGKSRLIAEFCDSFVTSRWKVGRGACLEFASRPYGPILEVLERVDAKPRELTSATKREQFDAITARLEAIGSRRALGIIIEDLHWADAASLDFLAYFATKLHRMRVLVLASFRADELHTNPFAAAALTNIARNARAGRIDLAPLRGLELRSFIDEALAGIALPDETRRAIALAGEGNPFYTEELLKGAVERNMTPSRRLRPDLAYTVRATLLDRLRPFDDRERRIVTQAAVIGRTFSLQLLAATLEEEPHLLLPALRRARDFQLIEELSPRLFRFRHGLTREAIYTDYLGAELQPRHRAIALALESVAQQERSLEALAYHWWAAADEKKAAHYNELAGDAAAGVHAHEDAIAFYERALESSGLEGVARGSILEKIAERRVMLTSMEDAQATYGAAADNFAAGAAHEREATCRAQAAIAAYAIGQSDPTAPLEAMLTRLDPAEYLAISRVHLGLAWLAATFWFPTRAAQHLEQVDRRALASASDIRLRFHNVAAWIAMTIGDLDGFRREHAAWIETAASSGQHQKVASAHVNGAMCLSFFGLHEEALESIEVALKVARKAHNTLGEEDAHAIAAMCYLSKGELASARAELEMVPATTENGVNVTFAMAWGTIVGMHLDDEVLIEKWFDEFEERIGRSIEIECGAGFAEVMARRGRHRDAAVLLQKAIPNCELIRGNTLTLIAAARYATPADRGRARAYLERGADGPRELPERPALALFDAIICEREGRSEDGIASARAAAEGFRRLRLPLLEAAALEIAGETESALTLFRRCGATFDVRRLAGEANATGSTHELLQQLSMREREIATLASNGRSNIEIARLLSITNKTVEKHLGSVYRKLNISSRAHLGGFLALRGQPDYGRGEGGSLL
jgi:DNA-binding CsgD family transcriptional regulator/tetratricopeptide (TPR) repeat protein